MVTTGLFSIPLAASGSGDNRRASGAAPGAGDPLQAFIGGRENSLLLVVADGFCTGQPHYNPCVLCGPSGTGKTYLLAGLTGVRTAMLGDASVLAVSGIEFARAVARAHGSQSLATLRNKFRRAAALVIDDLDQLAEKPTAQQELAATIDALVKRGSPVLVSLQQLPSETRGLSLALASRLSSGLVVSLAIPAYEARRELAAAYARELGLNLPAALLERIAGKQASAGWHPQTAPQIRETLKELYDQVTATHHGVNQANVEALLARHAQAAAPDPATIIASVAKHFRLPVGELRGPSRQAGVVRARSLAMYLARRLTPLSFLEIGRHFGNRDHTTVLHACRKIDGLYQTDAELQHMIDQLATSIAGSPLAGPARESSA
jgi:chromosomal replication initiator protein